MGRLNQVKIVTPDPEAVEPALTAWVEGGIRFFFAEVGGIVFEVMRAEGAGP